MKKKFLDCFIPAFFVRMVSAFSSILPMKFFFTVTVMKTAWTGNARRIWK